MLSGYWSELNRHLSSSQLDALPIKLQTRRIAINLVSDSINCRRKQPPFILFSTGVVGLEPTIANLEDWYSIQLSYTPIIGSPDRA